MSQDMKNVIDRAVLKIIPAQDDHIHFKTITLRFRETTGWKVGPQDGDAIVHDSINRLRKANLITITTHPTSPLCYSRTGGSGI